MQKDMYDKNDFELTILGTGTSTGVPTVSCKCPTCTSTDPRDKRLRCSVLIQTEKTSVVIDTGPDFRQQMIEHKVDKLDAAVFTHHHFDHIGGFDDIRAFNFSSRSELPIYLNEMTLKNMKRIFSYAFGELEQLGGGVPLFDVNIINDGEFKVGDIPFRIIPLLHGNLEVLGFRIGNIAYCTDTNHISDESLDKLKGLDTLILDALRPQPHTTHFNIKQAVEVAERIDAGTTYFTHIAHQIKHSEWEDKLPENMYLAYDGIKIKGEISGKD